MSEELLTPEGEELPVAETTEVEEVEAQEAETEEESATPEDAQKPKKRSRAEERINALTREKYDAQKRAEAYERQLAEMQQYIQRQQQPQTGDMPRLADYDYDEGRYQQALTQWSAKQRQSWEQEQAQRYQQQVAQQREMQRQATLQQKVSEGMSKYPDFMQKVFDPQLPKLADVNPAAFEAVIESDAAADVAYYLASNPQEVYQFASMSPVQAIRKVAQIEGRLAQRPTSKTVPPRPPTRVSGNSEAVQDPNKMSTAEWMEWRNKQIQSKR